MFMRLVLKSQFFVGEELIPLDTIIFLYFFVLYFPFCTFILPVIDLFSFHFNSGSSSHNYYLVQKISPVHFSLTALGISISHLLL